VVLTEQMSDGCKLNKQYAFQFQMWNFVHKCDNIPILMWFYFASSFFLIFVNFEFISRHCVKPCGKAYGVLLSRLPSSTT